MLCPTRQILDPLRPACLPPCPQPDKDAGGAEHESVRGSVCRCDCWGLPHIPDPERSGLPVRKPVACVISTRVALTRTRFLATNSPSAVSNSGL